MIDDDDIIKPINDRDEAAPEERSREHYREFKARETAICEDKGLTDAQSRVLWRLLLHFNHKTGQCDPSLRGLADRLGFSKTTIIDAVKAAQARGHLDWPPNPGGTKRRNQYVILKPNDQAGGLTRPKTTNHANGSKEESKRTSEEAREARKPGVPATPRQAPFRYSIKNAIAYVTAADHDTKWHLYEHRDRVLAQIRSEKPGTEVSKVVISIERPELNGFGGRAS